MGDDKNRRTRESEKRHALGPEPAPRLPEKPKPSTTPDKGSKSADKSKKQRSSVEV